ncbi:hypothetical protein P5673_004924 [Acropora cervicornis]|uniref:Uncharacterized protein n=1 Tax=Acropora cervicornis TaxID=6130 RepID=A0AAD9QZF3_ACRCE|nr:hypothetical protein P5673_004924 [Acropora cervicornis]
MAAPVLGCTTAPAHCRKGRQCLKFNGHKGRCILERKLAAKAARLDTRESELREANLDIQKKLDDTIIKLEELQKVNEASQKEASVVREELHNIKKQYE